VSATLTAIDGSERYHAAMPQRARLALLAVSIACFAFYAATFSFRPSTDAHVNVIQTRALVLHGDVDLSRYGHQAGYVVRRGTHAYSIYGVGVSVMAAPLLAIVARAGGSVIAHHAVPAIAYAAAAAAAMFVLLTRIFRPAVAVGGVTLFAFGTTIWPTGTTAFWAHAPAAFLVALGIGALFSDDERAPGWAGLAFGLAAFLRLPLALTGGAVGLYYASRGRGPFARFALGATAPVVAILVQNAVLWGSPFRTGYSFYDVGLNGDLATGLRGTLFSWWRGLFVYTPAMVLAVAGGALAVVRARDPHERRYLALALGALATVVVYARFTVWWGGDEQYGYRYLLDGAPSLVMLAAYAASRARSLALAGAALTAASVFVMALGSQPNKHGWDDTPFPAAFGDAPVGRAWQAFTASPGGVAMRLVGVALVVAVFVAGTRALARTEPAA
jgi:hypothetical protein